MEWIGTYLQMPVGVCMCMCVCVGMSVCNGVLFCEKLWLIHTITIKYNLTHNVNFEPRL